MKNDDNLSKRIKEIEDRVALPLANRSTKIELPLGRKTGIGSLTLARD
jgi:hypothetical protein